MAIQDRFVVFVLQSACKSIRQFEKALFHHKQNDFALRLLRLALGAQQCCVRTRFSRSADEGGLALFGLFEGFGQGGHHFEDVGDDAVIGDFEDGGILIFVDGDDGAGPFHADDVLDGAADA